MRYLPKSPIMSNRLREAREAKGLSLRAVERQTGINKTMLSEAERGERNLQDYHKMKLVRLYDRPLTELFFVGVE